MRRPTADIVMPWFCLTCGYGEVPGEDFNAHECDDFRQLSREAQDANRAAHWQEARRRLTAVPQ